jgi:hypothetical protein
VSQESQESHANFYTSGMACRGMDAESCPNDGTKMHNVNFTKNDVAEVAEMAENRVLNDNLCHLCHLCQCKFYTSG